MGMDELGTPALNVRRRRKMDELWYLGSPYSHPDAWMRELRFRAVARVVGALMERRGIAIFCPIAHSHPISETLPQRLNSHDFWMKRLEPLEPACKGLIVCALPGWQKSKGLKVEIELFSEREGKAITECYNPRGHFTATEWAMLEAGRL